ncbi:glycosyltransferase family 39 protein [Aureitalea sp. L0-47]|uniref:glycosyltransferase family 39 protein n=1 Tax=Aureitalea sp. L0-47 TaxID=2816962 RepID=UPI002237467F|nr:glycosyltransferase family 39 protein [Aureitalea sp. L0-47]MCW5519863.1 glycosyltransferase family 39 protein [Aureitalea sp. L0-47]
MNQLTIKFDRRFLAGCILLAAFLLRIYHLNYEGLWNDELFTADTASPNLSIDRVITILQLDIHPPLHNILANLWSHAFSHNDTSLRIFSVVWGLLGLLSIYHLGKLLFNKRVAFIALLLVVVNSFLIRFSQEVRAYAMLFVLVNYSVYFFVKLSRGEHGYKNIIAYGLFTAAMLYTHYFGMLVLAFQGITLFFFVGFKRVFKDIKAWSLSFLIPVALYSIWIPSMLESFSRDLNSWRDKASIMLFYEYFKEFYNDYILSSITLLLFILTIVLLILRKNFKKVSWINVGLKEHRKELMLLVLWIVIYFSIPFIKSSISTGMMVPRYFIGMVAPVILILAFYLSLISKKRLRNNLLGGIVVYSLMLLFLNERPYYTQTTSYREIAKTASEINNDAYVLFVSNHRRYFEYYIQQFNLGKRDGYFNPFVKLLQKDKPEEYFLFLDLRLTPKHFRNKIHVVDGYKEINSKVFKNNNNIKTVRLVHYKRVDSVQ